MWLSDILDRHCQQRGDAHAVVEGDRALTWLELRSAAHSLAAHLDETGIRHGDRVAVYSRNRIEVVVSYFALAHLGAPFVPVNHAMSPTEFADAAERMEIRHVLGERRPVERLGLPEDRTTVFDTEEFQKVLVAGRAAPPLAASLDDPLAVLLTSGTTGRPKGVLQTAGALRQMSLSWLAQARVDDSVRLLNLNSLSHGSITATLHYVAAGATLHVMREFQPRAVLRQITERGITHVWAVPQMLRFLMMAVGKDATVPNGLREIMFGASPMSPELLRDARRAFGCAFRNVYGMTEAGGTFCTWLSGETEEEDGGVPLESSGRSVPGIRVEIHDEENRPLPPGEVGEVCVLAVGRMSHYVGDAEETRRTVVDGWVRTGDLGWMDAHGYVHLKDRKKDVIKRGGQNVFPAEVENAVAAFDGVADVAVIGVPDDVWGEVPLAFVVVEEGAAFSSDALLAFLHGRLSSYKLPKEARTVAEIPRNAAGKVLRRVLAEQAGPAR
ncbi:class I adenylate-forming enzyme family protein [Streptomyces hydrogenans]|uniref:class I adenylate-forming enzyme family protein n=1 Tax=Streptomyces hydrogenans TaxID=1873719 RepID=UPI003425A00E